jgi:hypothetical protein
MKRFATIFVALLVVGLVLSSVTVAQVVKVMEYGVTPLTKAKADSLYNYVSTGLRNVPIGMKVYLTADTAGSGTTPVTSYTWSLSGVPVGSTASLSSTNTKNTTLIPDLAGSYYVTVAVNGGATHTDTLQATTYYGVRVDTTAGSGSRCGCHSTNRTNWKASVHATIFQRGVTGNLENDPGHSNDGLYAKTCIKCHTVGWEPSVSNGNFGYYAKQTGFDTSWYKTLTPNGSDYWIPKDYAGIYSMLHDSLKAVANIGCESCHGPAGNHGPSGKTRNAATMGVYGKYDPQMINSSLCNQCHWASKKHGIGATWSKSTHGILASGADTKRTSCFPCHSGVAFVKFANANGATPTSTDAYDANNDGAVPIGCPTCHDPHGNTNTASLRRVALDSLSNGYKTFVANGGNGRLCMNCHRGRTNVKTKITKTAPYYGWGDRFYNHYSGQSDMLYGQSGYEWGLNLGGETNSYHLGLTNTCVDCHMQAETPVPGGVDPQVGTNLLHLFAMTDTLGAEKVNLCKNSGCHPEATTAFSQIDAQQDYAGLGSPGKFFVQYDSLFARLERLLPKDSVGAVVSMLKDSAKIANKPWLVQAVWNYYFVKNASGHGVHNPDYTIKLLKQSILQATNQTSVEQVGNTIPAQYALNQNYPNPFNPSTEISFSLPQRQSVTLEVYDMLGKRVNTLLSGVKEAGNYRVTWYANSGDGIKVPSGVYFYRLQAGNFSSVKKMVVLK